jgi:hypothetical protein
MSMRASEAPKFVLSERSVDGGWHHLTLDHGGLSRRLKLFSQWIPAVAVCADECGHTIGPAPPIMVVQLHGACPLGLDDLNQIAKARCCDVLFTRDAASEWRAAHHASPFAGFPGPSSLQQLKVGRSDLCVSELHSEVLKGVANDTVLDEAASYVGRGFEWEQLATYAPSAWRDCMREVPLARLEHFQLALPGLFALAAYGLGEVTITQLLRGVNLWQIPSAAVSAEASARPDLETLSSALRKTPEGRAAYKLLRELKAELYDAICLQERHLSRGSRDAVGSAIQEHAGRSGQCLSLSPRVRGTRVTEQEGFTPNACRFAAELGIDVYGDLGHYCYGLAMARMKGYKPIREGLSTAVVNAARQAWGG